jgi:hypothetical protein
MKDLFLVAVCLVAVVMISRDLVVGLRNGRMRILATGTPVADRIANPNLFRVYVVFNAVLLMAMTLVLFILTRDLL